MSIADKLNKILDIKQDIKSALEYKGAIVTDQFDTYPEQIRALSVENTFTEYPFLKIGYYNQEEMPWLNKLVDKSIELINNWDRTTTVLKGLNIWFFPVVNTSNVTDASKAFLNMSSLKAIGLIDTSNVTDMNHMFYGCYDLISVPKFNTSKVTNMSYMFYGCEELIQVPNFDVSSLTDASYMFYNTAIKEFPLLLNTGNITNMSYMFSRCNIEKALLSAYDTSSVTNMDNIFSNCTSLTEVDLTGCDLTKVTNFNNMVPSTIKKIDFSNAKIGNSFTFSDFKSNLPNLIYNNLDATLVTEMNYWFKDCTSIESIDLSPIKFGNVTRMYRTFLNCSNLKNINFGTLKTDHITSMMGTFGSCSSLETLDLSLFNTTQLKEINGLFTDSYIDTLILDNWDFTNITSRTSWSSNTVVNNLSLKNVKASGDFVCPRVSKSIDLSGVDTTNCDYFILKYCNDPVINLSSFNTSNFNSMREMFSYCSNITSLDLSHFDYSKVTDMYGMFLYSSKLRTVTMRGDNSVDCMSYMFYGCSELETVDLSELPIDKVEIMPFMFAGCKNLTEVKMSGNPVNVRNVEGMFNNILTSGVFYYDPRYDYQKIINLLPASWDAKSLYVPTECTNLSILVDDVRWSATTATIKYTAITNGYNPVDGSPMNNIVITGEAQSSQFSLNLTDQDKTISIQYTYLGVTATTTITQSAYTPIEVNLNNQWLLSADIENPDPTLYEGVYESFSNYNVNGANADCIITIDNLTNFDLYVRSNAEASYDYVQVFDLDSTTNVKASTSGKQNSGTTIDSYTLVSFTNISEGVHTIKVRYKKDSSTHSGTDRGYLLIPKNQ